MSTAAVKTERSENSPLSAEERPSQRPRTEGNDINHNDASSALITPARTTATGGGDSGTTATATTTQPSASVPVTQTQTERPTSSAFDNDLDDDANVEEPASSVEDDLCRKIEELRDIYKDETLRMALKDIESILKEKETEGIVDTAVSMGILPVLKVRMAEASFSTIEVKELILALLEKISSSSSISETVHKTLVETRMVDSMLSWMASDLASADLQKRGLLIVKRLTEVPKRVLCHPDYKCKKCNTKPIIGTRYESSDNNYYCQKCHARNYQGNGKTWFRSHLGTLKHAPLPRYKEKMIKRLVMETNEANESLLILKAMDEHQGSTEIQKAGCSIVTNILNCDPKNALGLKSQIKKAVMPKLTHLLVNHEESSSLYKLASELMKSLL